jgi:hypothetical protein
MSSSQSSGDCDGRLASFNEQRLPVLICQNPFKHGKLKTTEVRIDCQNPFLFKPVLNSHVSASFQNTALSNIAINMPLITSSQLMALISAALTTLSNKKTENHVTLDFILTPSDEMQDCFLLTYDFQDRC